VELFIFARFHAREGRVSALEEALRDEVRAARAEPRCLAHAAYRSLRDPRLFWIHSRWKDEEAFDAHAKMPHTVRFIEKVESLIDHPLDVTRAHAIV
jgi:quinol monooxygenase YgiN